MERRANPPGWVQPKAPYNPYDVNDARPAQGYPSEFKAPGKETGYTDIPQTADEYYQLRHNMKRINYTPRPRSELYPGQHKVLRRINTRASFQTGLRLTSNILCGTAVVYLVFFYKWNDFEDVFSDCYRLQLRAKLALFGSLSEQEYSDLNNRTYVKMGAGPVAESKVSQQVAERETNDVSLQRATQRHIREAEKIQQQRELSMIRATEIAEETLKLKSDKSWWKFW